MRQEPKETERLMFRVWDTENECYQEKYADDCYIRHDGRLVCVFWGDDSRPTACVEEKDAIIEKSIGLKDKNGTLVFCGDILRSGDAFLEVCWCYTLASFMFDDYDYSESGEYLGSGNLQTIQDTEICEMEIVGNIHQGVKKK